MKVNVMGFELTNIKNVSYGKIEMSSKKENGRADILGIYGQNGSGKTAVVDAFKILEMLMQGQSLAANVSELITANKEYMDLMFTFVVKADKEYFVKYDCKIGKNEQTKPYVAEEKIVYRDIELSGHSNKSLTYTWTDNELDLKPKTVVKQLGNEKFTDLIVAKKLSEKERTSFFFNENVADCFDNELEDIKIILYALHNFACEDLFVIDSENSNFMGLNLFMPFFVKYRIDDEMCLGTIPMPLNDITSISKAHYEDLLPVVDIINPVLNEIVPGLSIGIECYGEQLDEKGETVVRVELVSLKDDLKIPFRYESDGIKKIVSILVLLIAVYNESSMCVVVDELDAGVFEYLLGEILMVLNEGGKGQLLFTSHNLRPLELLSKDDIIFTTTNKDQRYIRFTNIGATNNLRDMYIRTLNLGGQKEEVYKPISISRMGMAFRRAKRGIESEQSKNNPGNC